MIKSFFTKFLTLFLCGTMLANVGCKSYDDDINSLNKEVENLKGEVVELNKLEERIRSVEQTAAEFTAIDFSKYVTDSKLTSELQSIQSDFSTTLAGYVKNGDLATTKSSLESMIAAKCTIADVEAKLAAYATVNETYKKSEVDNLLDGVKTSVNNTLGDKFATYMATYITGDEFKSAAGNAATSAVLGKLSSANAEYVNAVSGILDSFDGDSKVIRQGDLDPLKLEYDTKISNLWAAIGDLAGRIQSLVFVPANINGHANFGGMSAGDIKLNSAQSLEMTFRVSPASLAKPLVDGYNAEVKTVDMSFIAEEITRADMGGVTIEKVSLGEDGRIIVLAHSTYDYNNGASEKTLAVSLCIKKAGVVTNPDNVDTGIEFCSGYVVTDGKYNDVAGNFYFARKVDEKYVVYDHNTFALYDYEYTRTTSLALLADYSLVYKDGANYMSIADAKAKYRWDAAPVIAVNTQSSNYSGSSSNVKLDPADPTDGAANKAKFVSFSSTSFMSDNDIAKTYTWVTKLSISAAGKKTDLTTIDGGNSVKAVVTITAKKLADITLAGQTVSWTYAKYIADGDYITDEIIIPQGKLTAAQFNAMEWADATWTLTTDNDSAISDATVTAEAVTTPTKDTDSQIIKMTISDYEKGAAHFVAAADFNINSNTVVKVSVPVTIDYLPAKTTAFDASKMLTYASSTANLELAATFGEKVYAAFDKANPGQKFFASKAEFLAALKNQTPTLTSSEVTTATGGAKAKLVLGTENKVLNVTFTNVDFSKQNPVAYKIAATDKLDLLGMEIPLSGTVTFSRPEGAVLSVGTNLYPASGDELPYSIATGEFTGSKGSATAFTVNNIVLSQSYSTSYSGSKKVTYSVLTTSSTGSLPTISDAVMSWGTWNEASVQVQALLSTYDDAINYDVKKFNVVLTQPVELKSLTVAAQSANAGTANVTVNIYKALTLKATDTTPVFNATGKSTLGTDLGVSVTFGTPKYSSAAAQNYDRFSFNASTGVVTINGSDTSLAGPVTVTIPVTVGYKYTTETVTKDIVLTVK